MCTQMHSVLLIHFHYYCHHFIVCPHLPTLVISCIDYINHLQYTSGFILVEYIYCCVHAAFYCIRKFSPCKLFLWCSYSCERKLPAWKLFKLVTLFPGQPPLGVCWNNTARICQSHWHSKIIHSGFLIGGVGACKSGRQGFLFTVEY